MVIFIESFALCVSCLLLLWFLQGSKPQSTFKVLVKLLLLFSGLTLPLLSFAAINKVHAYRLKNGLQLIVKEDHRSPVVLSSIWYKVGGSYEHDGITGISHVLEHMMFRGTKQFPAGQLEKIISENGGYQNAMTTNDQTVYYQRLSADKLSISFRLEADRMRNLLLRKQDFSKEIQVVMEERRMRVDDDPNAITLERFNAAAYVNNPYHHPTVGWMNDLQNMTVENVRRWYQTWYAPNNAIIVVVGDVKPDKVLRLARKYFGSIKKSKIPVSKPRLEVTSLGSVHINVHFPAKLPLLLMGYQVPSLVQAKAKWQPYALDVLSAILGGSDSSRFTKDLIRRQQIATMAQTSYNIYSLHSNLFTFIAIPAQGHTIAELKSAILKQIRSLQTKPVSHAEMLRIKAQVIAQNVYNKDSLMNQAFDIGMLESVNLPWRLDQEYVKRIKAVTAKQIQRVAKTYLTPKNLTVAVLHPLAMKKESQ